MKQKPENARRQLENSHVVGYYQNDVVLLKVTNTISLKKLTLEPDKTFQPSCDILYLLTWKPER